MPPSTGNERAHRQRDAVQTEMRRMRAHDEPDDGDDLVETVGEEQRREREALEPDEDGDGED
jgi:hypothetical protein